jgi:hypothetical protein
MALKSMENGVGTPGRAKIAVRHLRTDKWWIEPVITVLVLTGFIIYSTWRAFENDYYYVDHLISPFYSPCLATSCPPEAAFLGTPFGNWYAISPALLILVFPLGFRLTCYFIRRTYYRAFWMSPPACAVAEPHQTYTGETRQPLILQNSHRYFFVAAVLFNIVLTYDAILSFQNPAGEYGHVSVGTLIIVTEVTLLWLYVLSCHSCRHAVGGRLKHFSKHPFRYKMWTFVSKLSPYHPQFAWASLIGVVVTDFYIRSVATGQITNFYFF